MKYALIALTLCTATTAMADTYVQGYMRKDGTYVAPHMRSSPDHNSYNNYSSQGNFNPYTGNEGTRQPGYDRGETNLNGTFRQPSTFKNQLLNDNE